MKKILTAVIILIANISFSQFDPISPTAPVTPSSIGALTLSQADARYLFKIDSTEILRKSDTTSLIPTKPFLSNNYGGLATANTWTLNQTFTGKIIGDTVLNLIGSLTLNDTVTVTGRLNVTQDLFGGNDIFSGTGRYFVAKFNASGTQGVAFNSTADNVGRFRNAGISTDARIIMGDLDLTDLATYADNAAALGGGLTANMIYKTATGEVRIVY